MSESSPKRVLFVCEGNRARSQLAEAMLRHHGAGPASTSTAPASGRATKCRAFTIAALDEAHYPSGGLRSKHYSEFADDEFDFLIVLCDTVRNDDPDLPSARTRLDWTIEDPGDAQKRGVSIEEALRENRHALRSHIVRFMEEQGCIFCRILTGEVTGSFVYRDDIVAAFMDIRPVHEGHVLVIPVGHWVTMDEVPEDVAGRIMAVSGRIARALPATGVPMDGYNLYVANGEPAGQEVFHVHVHILPRYRGDAFGLRFPPGYGKIADRTRLDELAGKLRASVSARSRKSCGRRHRRPCRCRAAAGRTGRGTCRREG